MAARVSAAERDVRGAYDLHMHSVHSDGTCTVAELVTQARALGLAGIAVTDHDGLGQLSAVRAAARELAFPVLAGTEVSACDAATGRKVHILAYGLEATADASSPLERMLAQTRAARTANTLWQAWTIARALGKDAVRAREALRSRGCARPELVAAGFSVDAVVEAAGCATAVYKQHVMDALTHLPYTDPAYQEVYRSLFKGAGIAVRDISYPEAADAVRAICAQGGVPVLAHPGQMDSWDAVAGLVDAGLRGIEAFHPDHGARERERALELAERFDLFVTGGSDYHGFHGAPAGVGVEFVHPCEAGAAVAELFEREATLA